MSGISDRIREFTRPTGEETLMAVNYPAPRIRVGMREAVVVAGIVLVALAAWLVLRTMGQEQSPQDVVAEAEPPEEVLAAIVDGQPDAIPAASAGVTPTPTSGATGATTPESIEDVVVSVVGAVTHPGLVTLAPEARVADALAVAVPRPEAVLTPLNLAQKLTDGEQILVPVEGEEPVAPIMGQEPTPPESEGGVGTEPVSLNTADAAELTGLNGVGEKTAAAIISHREQIGGFSDIAQLQDVKGIGPAKFADLQDRVTL